jgi:death-on-curing protein
MIKLSYEELLEIHDYVLNEYGGLPGVLNENLLKSSIENAFMTGYGNELYETDEEKISITIHCLIKNHGFRDANKRTAILVFHILLDDCDIILNASEEEYIELAINIAQYYDKNDILQWINNHKI